MKNNVFIDLIKKIMTSRKIDSSRIEKTVKILQESQVRDTSKKESKIVAPKTITPTQQSVVSSAITQESKPTQENSTITKSKTFEIESPIFVSKTLLEEKQVEETSQKVAFVPNMELPMDWENAFSNSEKTVGVNAESVSDGLILSLNNLGRVDIEYISQITSTSMQDVISELRGSIYQNPSKWEECFYKGWETAEEYLSGNLYRKWEEVKFANMKYNDYFKDNEIALESILPSPIRAEDIYVTIGSPWLPPEIIDDFICHLFGFVREQAKDPESYRTLHDESTGTWEIPNKTRYSKQSHIKTSVTYGTSRINALHIIERTLNMRPISITDEITDHTGKKKRILNKEETLLAIDRQGKILNAFNNWIFADDFRRRKLVNIFENKFNGIKKRRFDGQFLTFPTMSKSVMLFPYQKDAVARILFTPNTLLAHDVGSGKTFVMIASGEELKRMGISKKNMFVVPNNVVGQWKQIYSQMYPNSKVLFIEPKDFTISKRIRVLEDIRDNTYDGIVIAYSCFSLIPFSEKYYIEKLEQELEEINKTLSNKKKPKGGLEVKKKKLLKQKEELQAKLLQAQNKYNVYFDELKINTLFVDEAHNFKNVPIDTKVGNVLGINSAGSDKCLDMLEKVKHVQRTNNGRGIVFATGTPITNSITDAYIMQSYLQSGELSLLDLGSFDAWVGMFAEKQTAFEVDVDTNSYRMATRFSKFHNIPELTNMLSMFADFHNMDEAGDLPKFNGYSDMLVSKESDLEEYLKEISKRADDVRNGLVKRTEDNMLKITTDGRKAALDIRLVKSNCKQIYNSKVLCCASKVYEIYLKSSNIKGTQIIFSDISTPSASFNIYDDIKKELILYGIRYNEIAYIHDAKTDKERIKLFEDVRKGEIRVLLGSTFKLGMGVNVQDKLIAIHHIDVPWKPADMTQRNGRIIRQGNTNEEVFIYRYITEGSFDAYSWQLLETKQRFISDLLSGVITNRSGSEIDDTVLNYAEVKALAIGNPLIKTRVETANELSKYRTLQIRQLTQREKLKSHLLALPELIENQRIVVNNCKLDVEEYKVYKLNNFKIYSKEEYEVLREERKILREKLNIAINGNSLKDEEREFTVYQGFKIMLPKNMILEKPYIVLQNHGRYSIELANSELGYLTRLDNFLENLENHYIRLCERLEDLINDEKQTKEEISKLKFYGEEIEQLEEKLKELDKKLGVDKK